MTPAQHAILDQWEAIMPNHTRTTRAARIGINALAWALAIVVYGGLVVAAVVAVEWAFVP